MIFLVSDRKSIEIAEPEVVPHVIISVTTPNDGFGKAALRTNSETQGSLRLPFHETYEKDLPPGTYRDWIDRCRREGTLFTLDTARRIFRFLALYQGQFETLVVHCDAGLARSPGIAAALAQTVFSGESNHFIRRHYFGVIVQGVPNIERRPLFDLHTRTSFPSCHKLILEAWQS